jgi:hypothetical protein
VETGAAVPSPPVEARTASAHSPTLVKRASGSVDSARSIAALKPAGTSARSSPIGVTGSVFWAVSNWLTESYGWGTRPASNSYAMTAAA